jgi:hypothetical protein
MFALMTADKKLRGGEDGNIRGGVRDTNTSVVVPAIRTATQPFQAAAAAEVGKEA